MNPNSSDNVPLGWDEFRYDDMQPSDPNDSWWSCSFINEPEQSEDENTSDDEVYDWAPANNSALESKPAESWWNSLPEECRAMYREIEEECANGSWDFKSVKNGKPTLTGMLHKILYCDQIMELEAIMDELYKRHWDYGKQGEKVVLMLLAKSTLFCGDKKSGFHCPSSSRRWFRHKH